MEKWMCVAFFFLCVWSLNVGGAPVTEGLTPDTEDNCFKTVGLTCEDNVAIVNIDQEVMEQCNKNKHCEAGLYQDDVLKKYFDSQTSNKTLVNITSGCNLIRLKAHYTNEKKWIVVCYQPKDGSEQKGEKTNKEEDAGTSTDSTKGHHWFAVIAVIPVAVVFSIMIHKLISHQKKKNNSHTHNNETY